MVILRQRSIAYLRHCFVPRKMADNRLILFQIKGITFKCAQFFCGLKLWYNVFFCMADSNVKETADDRQTKYITASHLMWVLLVNCCANIFVAHASQVFAMFFISSCCNVPRLWTPNFNSVLNTFSIGKKLFYLWRPKCNRINNWRLYEWIICNKKDSSYG